MWEDSDELWGYYPRTVEKNDSMLKSIPAKGLYNYKHY